MSRNKNVNAIFETNEICFNLPNKIKNDLLYTHTQKLTVIILFQQYEAQIFLKNNVYTNFMMKNQGSAKVSLIPMMLNTAKRVSRKITSPLPVQGSFCNHLLLHTYLNSLFNLTKDFLNVK